MRDRYSYDSEGGLYFITSTIIQHIPVFTSDRYFSILIDAIKFCQDNKNLQVFAYVILDNHFHMVAYAENLSKKISSIKSYTARKIIDKAETDDKRWLLNQFKYYKKSYKDSKYQVWQEGSHPKFIQSVEMAQQKIEYIHNNSVKRGLVDRPEHWKYSSANDNNLLEVEILSL